jgi:hypothetical protein
MLGRSPGTISNWRVQGIGPKHFTVNGRCYYWANEVAAYGRGEAIARNTMFGRSSHGSGGK